MDGFGRDPGRVWDGFWMGLGLLGRLLVDVTMMFDILFGRVCPKGATGTPALPRYAPRSVTIRGGSHTPTRVGFEVSL